MIDFKELDTEFDAVFKTEAREFVSCMVEPHEIDAALAHLSKRYKVLNTDSTPRPNQYWAVIPMKDFRTAEEKFDKLSKGFTDQMAVTEYIDLLLWLHREFELTEVNTHIGQEMFEPEVNGVRVSSEELARVKHEISMTIRGNLVNNAKIRTLMIDMTVGKSSVSFAVRKSSSLEV